MNHTQGTDLDRDIALWDWRPDVDAQEEGAKARAAEAFREAVERNVDRTLPLFGCVEQWPVSALLGEINRELSKILFKACHHAANRKDADAAEVLREFYRAVGDDYAGDHHGAWK